MQLSRPILLLLLLINTLQAPSAQSQTRGVASVVATGNQLSFSDSTWSKGTAWGGALRFGYRIASHRGVDVIPHVQIGWTSVGGIRPAGPFEIADGEFGLQLRTHIGPVRPYLLGRMPLWHTVAVERATEHREYARNKLWGRGTWGIGIEIPIFHPQAGLDIGFSEGGGTARYLDIFDRSANPTDPRRFRGDSTISESYLVRRIYLGYSGPFSVVDPIPGWIAWW